MSLRRARPARKCCSGLNERIVYTCWQLVLRIVKDGHWPPACRKQGNLRIVTHGESGFGGTDLTSPFGLRIKHDSLMLVALGSFSTTSTCILLDTERSGDGR
jgi:hypothetical protein